MKAFTFFSLPRMAMVLLFITSSICLAEPIELNDHDRYDLSTRLRYFEDPSNSLQIEQMLHLAPAKWTQSTHANTSFGYSDSSYWFHVSLSVKHSNLWYLWLRYALHDEVDVFWIKDGKVSAHQRTGDALPFSQRDVKSTDFAFSRYLEAGETIEVLMRLKTAGSYKVPLEIRQKDSFEENMLSLSLFEGFYYGVLFVMSVYNFVLFFITGIRSYVFYVFYVFSSLGSRLAVDGTGFQYLWPSVPALNQYAIPIFFLLSSMSFWLFAYSFLNFHKAKPLIKNTFLLIGVMNFPLAVGIATLDYHQIVPMLSLYAMLLMLSTLISSIFSIFKGQQYAGIFAVATMMTALAFSFSVFESLGFYHDQTMMIYSYPIARMFEIILFAIALGVRIRHLQERRLVAERESITHREQSLQHNEQYQRLYDSALTGNFVLGHNGVITRANKTFYKMLDTNEHEARNIQDYFDDNLREEAQKAYQLGGTIFERELRSKSGRWLSIMISKVEISQSHIYECSMVDVTHRVMAEHLQAKAENDKMTALQQLIVGVAHEINTPLGVVRTSSDFTHCTLKNIESGLEQSLLTKSEFINLLSACKEALSLVDVNLERMADLIKSFKHVSVEQMSFQPGYLNVNQLIASIKELAQTLNLPLQVNLLVNHQQDFFTFPDAYQWTVNELLQNTLSHGGEVTQVRLSIETHEKGLAIEYYDNGKGVNEHDLMHIFEPFFTTRRGIERKLGLGLYQVRNIITQLLKGTVSAVSGSSVSDSTASNVGLLFKIEIPYSKDK